MPDYTAMAKNTYLCSSDIAMEDDGDSTTYNRKVTNVNSGEKCPGFGDPNQSLYDWIKGVSNVELEMLDKVIPNNSCSINQIPGEGRGTGDMTDNCYKDLLTFFAWKCNNQCGEKYCTSNGTMTTCHRATGNNGTVSCDTYCKTLPNGANNILGFVPNNVLTCVEGYISNPKVYNKEIEVISEAGAVKGSPVACNTTSVRSDIVGSSFGPSTMCMCKTESAP